MACTPASPFYQMLSVHVDMTQHACIRPSPNTRMIVCDVATGTGFNMNMMSAKVCALLLLGGLLPLVTATTTFANKAELLPAVNAWCANATSAEAQYGSIADWKVGSVNDMSYLFCGFVLYGWDVSYGCRANKATCNPDLSRWDVSSATTMNNMVSRAARGGAWLLSLRAAHTPHLASRVLGAVAIPPSHSLDRTGTPPRNTTHSREYTCALTPPGAITSRVCARTCVFGEHAAIC